MLYWLKKHANENDRASPRAPAAGPGNSDVAVPRWREIRAGEARSPWPRVTTSRVTEGVKEGRRGHEDGYASSSSEEDDSEEAYVRMHALKEMEERGLTGNFVTWVQCDACSKWRRVPSFHVNAERLSRTGCGRYFCGGRQQQHPNAKSCAKPCSWIVAHLGWEQAAFLQDRLGIDSLDRLRALRAADAPEWRRFKTMGFDFDSRTNALTVTEATGGSASVVDSTHSTLAHQGKHKSKQQLKPKVRARAKPRSKARSKTSIPTDSFQPATASASASAPTSAVPSNLSARKRGRDPSTPTLCGADGRRTGRISPGGTPMPTQPSSKRRRFPGRNGAGDRARRRQPQRTVAGASRHSSVGAKH